ncbi:MAG TPA: acyltransferase [Chryseosolibacter sp.]|nr:acyltransferase [Chryseosolibacter sp.]
MSKFLSYIHNLRGVAILFVVGVHAHGFDQQTTKVFDAIFDPSEGNGTVLFLFIGGFLFQYLTHNHFDYRKYIETKFKVIILPYLIISIPLIIIRIYTNFESLALPANFDDWSVTRQIVFYIFTGTHMPPFWFITTIILVYLTAPLLHVLDRKNFYQYVFPLFVLLFFFTYRPLHNANPFLSYIHFVPVYMAGMCASFYKERILANSRVILALSAFVYLAITIIDVGAGANFSRDLRFEDVLYKGTIAFNVYALKVLMLCMMLLCLVYEIRKKEMPLIEMLGNYSFGIFFVHYAFISISGKIVEISGVTIDFSLPVFVISYLFILLASTVTVYFVKRITGKYSRYLIGS